jgi:Protein tyrosine and serine/threonine kinase
MRQDCPGSFAWQSVVSDDADMAVDAGIRTGFPTGRVREVGDVRLDRLLGTGAYATVWLGHLADLEAADSEPVVAVKILSDRWSEDPTIRRTFVARARRQRRLASSALTSIHQIGELPDGRPYVVTSWADRGSLEARLAGGALGLDELLDVGVALTSAVAALHARGEVHGCLTSANVLFASSDADTTRLVLTDPAPANAMTSDLAGSAVELGLSTDISVIGGLLLNMAIGRAPAPTRRRTQRRSSTGLPALDRIIAQARTLDPKRQIASCAELGRALENLRRSRLEPAADTDDLVRSKARGSRSSGRRTSDRSVDESGLVRRVLRSGVPIRAQDVTSGGRARVKPAKQKTTKVSLRLRRRSFIGRRHLRGAASWATTLRWQLVGIGLLVVILVAIWTAMLVRTDPRAMVNLRGLGLHVTIAAPSDRVEPATWTTGDGSVEVRGVSVAKADSRPSLLVGTASMGSELAGLTDRPRCDAHDVQPFTATIADDLAVRGYLSRSTQCSDALTFHEAVFVPVRAGTADAESIVHVVVQDGDENDLLEVLRGLGSSTGDSTR